jgi:hypothetical protein
MTYKEIRETKPPLPGSLVGVDGNAFALMAHFQRVARREGWSKEEINAVIDEAKSGDYDHLVVTLDLVMEG